MNALYKEIISLITDLLNNLYMHDNEIMIKNLVEYNIVLKMHIKVVDGLQTE